MFRTGNYAGCFLAFFVAGCLLIPQLGVWPLLAVIVTLRILAGFFNSLERRDKRDVREGRHHPR